jgi:outer membrane lipoprotein-sorting protein
MVVRSVLLAVLSVSIATAQAPSRGTVDQRAVDLMDRVETKMRSASTLEVVKKNTVRGGGSQLEPSGWRVVKVQVQRPNKYRVETLELDDRAKRSVYNTFRLTDGKVRLSERLEKGRFNPKTRQYTEWPESKWKRDRYIELTGDNDVYVWDDDVQTLAGLYVIDDEHPGLGHDWRHHKLSESTFQWIRYVGTETWKDKTYEVVEWAYDIGIHPLEGQVSYTQKMYVGPDTLVHRVVTTTSKGAVLEDEYQSIKLNPRLPASLFTIKTAGVRKEMDQIYFPKHKVGEVLPDWTLPAAIGDSINFSRFAANNKATIVWFWDFY